MKKSVLLILIIALSTLNVLAQKQSNFQLRPLLLEEKKDSIPSNQKHGLLSQIEYKNPLVSFLWSFSVPGLALGQLYNRQFVNFGVRVGITALSLTWIFASKISFESSSKSGNQIIYAFVILATNWITSFIEAPFSSSAINRKNAIMKIQKN